MSQRLAGNNSRWEKPERRENYDNTRARQHDGTKARLHEGTKEEGKDEKTRRRENGKTGK